MYTRFPSIYPVNASFIGLQVCLLMLASCTPSPRFVTVHRYESSEFTVDTLPVQDNDSIRQVVIASSEPKKDSIPSFGEKTTPDTAMPPSSWEGVFDTEPQKKQDTSTTMSERGIAAWYGPGFERKKTASGERFNSRKFTAAHRTLPFNTMVRVTNLNNGKSVVVRINDRGPFDKDRIIDLSAAAARSIGLDKSGTASVIVEILR